MTARRRTSVFRSALLRYCSGDVDDSIIFASDAENDDEECTNTSSVWYCHKCPLMLSNSKQIRVLAPCGHVFCPECSVGVTKCPVRICNQQIEKVIAPKIQEGDPIDEKIEAENMQAERTAIAKQLYTIQNELADFKKKRRNQEKDLTTKIQIKQQFLDQQLARKRTLEVQVSNIQTKVKLAKFISTIENLESFPVANKGIKCKAYYEKAALETAKHFREINQGDEHELSTKHYQVDRSMSEKETFLTAIAELVRNGREEFDDDELWQRLEKLAPNKQSVDFEFNLSVLSSASLPASN